MNQQDMIQLHTDILIIGGGSAGTMAAIRAKELYPDFRVVIFEKSDFQYSGTIPRGMDALNIVTVPGIGSPEEFTIVNRAYCDEICDDSKSYILAQRSYPLMEKLIKWGVCFPRTDDGYDITSLHPGARFTVSMDDPDLKQILVKKALDAGVRVENRTAAIGLLKEGETVAGAIGVNVRTAEMISCSAKAVILAAGGTARFGLPPSGHLYGTYDYPGNTGDGYLLGFRAGAPLTSMECTMCYCLLKDVETPGMAMMIQKGGSLLDAMGRAVMENEFYNLSDVNKLQNSPVGPLRLKLRHLPEERIEEIENLVFSCERPITQRFLKDRGLDVRRDDLELATSEIFLCGGHGLAGLVIDANGATSVPGLYGAGDTAPLPRGYLTGAFVFGELAAENACQFATGRGTPVVDETSIARAVTRVERFSSLDRGTVPITHFEYKVRRYINEYLTPPKNEYRLLQLRHLLEVLKKDLSEVVRIRTERDLFLALEVENIIDSAFMSTVASLERKESRWGFWHQRGDFPERDDTRWKRHLDLVQNPGSDFPHIRWRDVERIKTLGGIE